ncbi:hypothetical protein mRhiFer1_009389 [Rhinolophus ferrumequinum]|uniref:Uncharacterized protein n=1 Tax=Rhinolophus ferrumequinum TaxID=59479 RepID=A0A7J7RQ93_RHIFE|nr:hypothetical protein mRhiFer1_009389 [Rhinolophus ferrumequinum]
MARPRPPRQTTSLGPGDHPRCRAGIGARQQQLAPLERPPRATALVPRPPFQPVPRLHPTPQNMLLEMWSRGGCKGTTGWEISPVPGYQTSGLASGWGRPSMVPASFLCLMGSVSRQEYTLQTVEDPRGTPPARGDCMERGKTSNNSGTVAHRSV